MLDEETYAVTKKANLSSLLRPLNYFEAFNAFVERPHAFNPVFEYRFPDDERLRKTRDEIARIRDKAVSMESAQYPIASLYREKLDEAEGKLSLIESYKREDFSGIARWNAFLFGPTDPGLLRLAEEKVSSRIIEKTNPEDLLGRVLSLEEIANEINGYLRS